MAALEALTVSELDALPFEAYRRKRSPEIKVRRVPTGTLVERSPGSSQYLRVGEGDVVITTGLWCDVEPEAILLDEDEPAVV